MNLRVLGAKKLDEAKPQAAVSRAGVATMNSRAIFFRNLLLLLGLVVPLVPGFAQPPGEKFPPELVKFVPYQDAPIFAAAKGQWDAKIRERGWILKEGDLWKLWYTGYDGTENGLRMLGYATSKDGIHWTRHPNNPIYKEHWVEDMMVVKHDGKYWMFAEGKDDLAHLLVSDDGLAWTRIGLLDIRKKDGTPIPPGPYGTPTAWYENGTWYLYYERHDLGIWLATSKDMKVWTQVQDEPVLSPGPGEYDKDLIALNQIVKHKGRYVAYYHGTAKTGPNARMWSTCVAASTDLVHWEKYPGNPLQPVEQNKSSGIVVHDGEKFRLYTMHPSVYLHVAPINPDQLQSPRRHRPQRAAWPTGVQIPAAEVWCKPVFRE
jgi:beta-1,2-mannobiose phosphorylase / 1,2-beta-oligomannan phosphorylase